jgi:flagellar hook-length control protein FliK
MQFNPIFFSSGSNATVPVEGNIQTLKETKYLFSDLVKVEEELNSNNKKSSELFNEPGISLLKQNTENKIELEFNDSEDKQYFPFLFDKSNPSVFALLNSVYNFADPKTNIIPHIDNSNNVQNSINEIEIKNVDIEMLKDFLMDLKFNSLENPVTFTKLANKTTEQLKITNSNISTIKSQNQTFSSIEEVMKLLESNSKVSFELVKATNNNLTNNLFKADKHQEIEKTINFRTGALVDEIVKSYTQTSNAVSKNNSESLFNNYTAPIDDGKKIIIEINKNNSLSGFSKELNLVKKQYSVQIKVLNQRVTNSENKTSQESFLSGKSIQNLLNKNETFKSLRVELTELFKNVDEIKITNESSPAKNVSNLGKPIRQEIKVTQQKTELNNQITENNKLSVNSINKDYYQTKDNFEFNKDLHTTKKTNEYVDKNITENQNKTVINDSKVNQSQTELKSDVNSNSNQKQNSEDNSKADFIGVEDLNIDESKKNNPVFEIDNDKKINIADKNILNTIQLKTENNIPQQKLLNNLEVFSKISDLIKKKDRRSIEIKLNPPELGKMKVKIEYGEKKLMIRMEVENETAKQLLNQNIEQLKQNINQNGMQLKEIFVSLSTSDQKQQKSSGTRKRESDVETKSIFEDTDANEKAKMMGYNTYEYLI